MAKLLFRSFVSATIFSLVILLILGVSEQTGNLGFGSYFFIFVVVAYGINEIFPILHGPNQVPVILAWLTLLPAMVVFYTPVIALGMFLFNRRSVAREARSN